MTLHLIDIASYQAGINLDTVRASGFSLVNIKTTQGLGYTFSPALSYARQAHARGMGISGFHWLDNSGTGAAQAAYCWRTLGPIVAECGPVALQVDNEDPAKPATWAITRDFVYAIADKLGHLPYMYTGDWWAAGSGRASWDVHSLTPWLMAAPNAGYDGSYPGDTSPHWRAGYWGYTDLSLMQYAVGPIAGAGGGNISKAAIRDPNLWAALTGTTTPTQVQGRDVDMDVMIAQDGAGGLYRVEGGHSYPLPAGVNLSSLAQVIGQRHGAIAAPGAGADMREWTTINGVAVRKGWSADIFGPLAAGAVDVAAIVAAVRTAVGGLNVALGAADVARVVDALRAAADVPLNDADMPAIEAALRHVLTTGTAGPTSPVAQG